MWVVTRILRSRDVKEVFKANTSALAILVCGGVVTSFEGRRRSTPAFAPAAHVSMWRKATTKACHSTWWRRDEREEGSLKVLRVTDEKRNKGMFETGGNLVRNASLFLQLGVSILVPTE